MVEELEAARHLQQEFARHPSHQPLVQNKVGAWLAHGCLAMVMVSTCEALPSRHDPLLWWSVQGVASSLIACCCMMSRRCS